MKEPIPAHFLSVMGRNIQVDVVVDDSLEPFLQQRGSEIEEQSKGEIHPAQVSKKLFAMNRVKVLHGFG